MVAIQSAQLMLSSRRVRIAALFLLIIGIAHHADHVLRADHSGYPFTPHFNEFTISLLIPYPVAFFILLAKGRYWLKFWLMTAVYTITQLAHVFIETPVDQYTTWALNASTDPDVLGQPNLLNIASPLLGWIAVIISISLSVAMLTVIYLLFVDTRQGRGATSRPASG